MMSLQVLKPVGIGVLVVIISIGIVALVAEITELEEIAKIIVVPCLVLLIAVTGYSLFIISKHYR